MSPQVIEGTLIEYSDMERLNMSENGVCVTCDFKETCGIIRGTKSSIASWTEKGEHIKMKIEYCSLHEVQGIKTFGWRGK